MSINSAISALHGIKVLDLTSIVFGPYASQILADYGAEIIKVESLTGDSTRYTGPAGEEGMSAIFLGVNRNKKSIALDLKQDQAREVLLRLVDQADVFMHSIRPQKMKKLGLDPETLCERNPKLIYAGLYGFGSAGRYAGKPAYDDIIQGLSGVPDLISKQSGTPRYFPVIAADKTCGLIAAHAMLAALFQRERTGLGQQLEVPMFEAMTSYMLVEHFYGRHLADQDLHAGYDRVLSEWRKPYKTLDGYLCMMPYTDSHWRNFFQHTGFAELLVDERFKSINQRTRHINQLYEITGKIVAAQTTSYWLGFCEKHEIPASRINTINELEQDPHLQDVGLFVDIEDRGGNYRFVRNPVAMANSTVPVKMPPRLGEHTTDVLVSLGYTPEEIQQFYKQQFIR
ncbi:MAG: CoA transferase [Alcaligenaceae bacterium]|nr:CoA transferase [Alcaligenaceae bacterium]